MARSWVGQVLGGHGGWNRAGSTGICFGQRVPLRPSLAEGPTPAIPQLMLGRAARVYVMTSPTRVYVMTYDLTRMHPCMRAHAQVLHSCSPSQPLIEGLHA